LLHVGATPLPAQDAARGEIPTVLDPGAPEGATLTTRVNRPFDRYALPVGPYGRGTPNARELEGRIIRSAWRLDDPEAATAAVMAGYRQRLEALGYEPIFACETEACGGFDFRFAVEFLPPPAMLVDTADFAQLSARRPAGGDPGDATHVSVLASRALGAVYVQTVAVAPAGPALAVAPASKTGAGAESRLSPDASGVPLLERLTSFGHARLDGLDFEPGSAALTAGSTAALDRTAEELAANPDLSVLIVGHSDNRGALEDNLTLSRRRAEAVREALVSRGIEPARLAAHGAGFLAPVATNATDEGRALNRRVELVLR
jgi:OOP family OmpA-OmpF porin